jgi:hypothetical protein
MTLFQNLILFTKHYGNLQEMLEMASFLRYVDLYLASDWGQFYLGHFVLFRWYWTQKGNTSLRFGVGLMPVEKNRESLYLSGNLCYTDSVSWNYLLTLKVITEEYK